MEKEPLCSSSHVAIGACEYDRHHAVATFSSLQSPVNALCCSQYAQLIASRIVSFVCFVANLHCLHPTQLLLDLLKLVIVRVYKYQLMATSCRLIIDLQRNLRCDQMENVAAALLHSYGDGFLGALGTGSYENVLKPTPLPTTTDLSVKEISVGWAHAGFVTHAGDAYVFGRTHSFRDVIRTTNMQRVLPKLVGWMNSFTCARGVDTLEPMLLDLPEGERVKTIVCSTALTFLLTEGGKLFTLGANSYGQCGIGEESVSVQLPTHVNIDGDEIVDIAAGYQHGLAVTKAGTVFTWGKGERGQLGYGTGNTDAPQELIALKGKKIVKVGAGFSHSCALGGLWFRCCDVLFPTLYQLCISRACFTEDGELYMWGKLLNPEGKAVSNGDQVVPRLVKTSDDVKLFKSSQFHTTFITGKFGRVQLPLLV